MLGGGTAASATRDQPAPAATEDRATAAVVTALVGAHPADAQRLLPAGFATTMGYRPVVEHLRDGWFPTNPTGSCSSPITLPARFEPLCRTHDFGYDLLRYAEQIGHPLGGWARLALDTMLVDRMRSSCVDSGCVAAAYLAKAGLGINTWRQHDGPPARGETVLDITVGVGERGVESLVGR